MGEVYLAEDTLIHRQVAVKVVRAETTLRPASEAIKEAARLFQREMKAISMLDHPHILPLFDYGEEQVNETMLAYLVMPFRQEGSLATWLSKRSGSALLPLPTVVQIVRQAADALQYAHDRQIVHQDVKPANFLIRSNRDYPDRPDLLLADFGVAKFTTATSSASQSVRGTPIYMAPEQWAGHPVPATDQYALAIMTYELLTDHVPFQGGLAQLMYQHLHVQPEPPSALNPQLAKDIDTVILSALAKKPQDRFASISTFARAFQQAAHSELEATPIIQPLPSLTPLPPSSQKQPSSPLAPPAIPLTPQAVPPSTSSSSLPSNFNISQSIPPAFLNVPPSALPPSTLSPSATPTSLAQPLQTTASSGRDSSPKPGLRPDAPITSGRNTSDRNPSRGIAVLLIGLALILVVGSFLYVARTITPTSSVPKKAVSIAKAPLSQQVFTYPATVGSDITTFDPALSLDPQSVTAIDMVFTGLVQLDNQLNVRPQLAQSWQMASDGLTWTFHLRSGLKFSDGTPLTSQDVAYSIDRALQPATQSATAPSYLALIKDSEKLSAGQIRTIIGDSLLTPDAETIEIVTNKSASYFLDALSYPCSYVIEKRLIDKYGAKNFTDHLTEGGGDGPFKVSQYTHGREIDFVPNPTYYGSKPQLQKVIFPFYKDTSVSYEAYLANQVDMTVVPTTNFAAAKTNANFHQEPQMTLFYYTMSYTKKPFDSIKIRQAFELAINKDLIVSSVWKGSNIATNHIVPQGMVGYNPNLTGPAGVKSTTGDTTLAKQLLQQGMQEEGYSSVAQIPPITLTFSSGGDQSTLNEVAALQQMWQTVLGITVKANDVSFNNLISDESMGANNPLQLYAGPGWTADYPDPQDWTTLQFDQGAVQNSMNYGQNTSSDAATQRANQQAMRRADTLPNGSARVTAYNDIEQQLVNDVAWLPLKQQVTNFLLKPYVQGFVLNGENLIPPDDWGNIYIAAH